MNAQSSCFCSILRQNFADENLGRKLINAIQEKKVVLEKYSEIFYSRYSILPVVQKLITKQRESVF